MACWPLSPSCRRDNKWRKWSKSSSMASALSLGRGMDSGLVNAAALSAVVPLDAVNVAYVARVGGKAANLGELKKAGFKVPDGFIVIGEPGEELADALR